MQRPCHGCFAQRKHARCISECGTGRRARESSAPRSRGRRATSAYLVLPQQALNAARASARGMLLMRSIVRLDMNPRLYVAQRRGGRTGVRGDFTTTKNHPFKIKKKNPTLRLGEV